MKAEKAEKGDDDDFLEQLDLAFAALESGHQALTAPGTGQADAQQEATLAQALQIVGRPRKMARRQDGTASTTSGPSDNTSYQPVMQITPPLPSNIDPSSQPVTQNPPPPPSTMDPSSKFTFLVPRPLALEDKGKGKEVRFDLQAHEREFTKKLTQEKEKWEEETRSTKAPSDRKASEVLALIEEMKDRLKELD